MDKGFRDDVNPQLPLWGRKEIHFDAHNDADDRKYSYISGRERYEWNSNRMDMDFVSADSQGSTGFSLNPTRNFELNVGNYEMYEEDRRWRNSSLETDRKYGNNGGVSLHLRGERQELFERGGYEDASRYNNIRAGGKRSDVFFNRSPRKQLQKKSALQRIQLGKTNNRTKSHDHGHLSKSYHDESNSVGGNFGGSFKGKEMDVYVDMKRKMEEREKSPVELDVSFKSNALVAKAIRATPSLGVDSSRNRKIRKLKLSDSLGAKFSEHLDGSQSSTNHFDKDHSEFAKNVISDKTDSPACCSHHSTSPDECQQSAEKVNAVKADNRIHGSDIPSDSDKDLGQLAKKIRVSASDNLSSGGSQPCSSDRGGKNANKESPGSVETGQNVKDVSSDGTIDGTPRKRKRAAILLQSEKDGREAITGNYSYADNQLQAILPDEGLSSSAVIEMVSSVASELLADVAEETVKSSSEEGSDLRKDNMDIKSCQLFLPLSSAMISVLQSSGDAFACEAADRAEMSVRDGCLGLHCEKVVEHSYQDEPILFENSPGRNMMDSVEGNATKENKFHELQMKANASMNEGSSNSSSEQKLCRMSEQINVVDSRNANTEESSPNQVSISETNDIVEGFSDPVASVGNSAVLCVSPKLEESPKENPTLINPIAGLDMASQENTENFATSISQKAPCGDEDTKINLRYMENSDSLSKNLCLHVDVSCDFSTNSADRLVDSDAEALFNNMSSSSEDVPSNLLLDMQNSKSKQSEISNGHNVSGVETVRPPSISSKIDAKLSQALTVPVNSHKVSPLSQCNSKVMQYSVSLPDKPSISNNQLTNIVHGAFPGHTSLKHPSVGKASAFNHVSRPRTWHRTGTPSQSVAGSKNPVSLQINSKKELPSVQSSYIRKGNSLVRKPSPAGAVPQGLHGSSHTLNRLSRGIDKLKKARGSEDNINIIGPSTSATTGGFSAGPERPKTPPLTGTGMSLNCKPADRGDSSCSQADPFKNHSPGEMLDYSNSAGNVDVKKCGEDGPKPSEDKDCEAGSRSNLNSKSRIDERSYAKKLTYVKRKSNQLVAASNSGDRSSQSSQKRQALSSEGYYKRRKNQLIRTSVEDNIKQRAAAPGNCVSSMRQETAKNTRNKSSGERQNGCGKKKFSLVWTLHGTLSSKKDGNSGHFNRVRPFLFPWKRAMYWINFKHSLNSMPNGNLASAISWKLLLSQKSGTIYRRSLSGFSLRRSKALGTCSRSLKWSKSLERNSRKANEDATLAVVAAEKRKSEQNGAALPLFIKSRNYVSRERIFRIGSERYRMDPTGKTLQRISDCPPRDLIDMFILFL